MDQGQSSGAALPEELLGSLLGFWQGRRVSSGSETEDSSHTGFCYCHGGLVKSHLDKPSSFFGLHLPALEWQCLNSEGDLEHDSSEMVRIALGV